MSTLSSIEGFHILIEVWNLHGAQAS
jgi:hypothetical protein